MSGLAEPDGASNPAIAIFDIDGVLADIRHRLHHVERKPKNWPAFFATMDQDEPLTEGIELAREYAASGLTLVFLTGRSETYRTQTSTWLQRYDLPAGRLMMRPDNDRRPARIFKPEVVCRIARAGNVVVVVDDDGAVVDTLRSNGWNVVHATWMPANSVQQQSLFEAQEKESRT